jgi:dephospho-CoA kinase
MENMRVIAFVGMPGSGKSVCVDCLTKKGFPSVYFGGVVMDELKARGLEVNEANEKEVREGLRETEGKDAIAKRIVAKIEALGAQGQNKVVADGIYSWSEYKIFKERFGDNATIIAITAPRKLRHERLAKRPVRPLTDKESSSRDYAEIENLEKGGPIANADYTIVNDETPENLYIKIDKILEKTGF